MSLTINLMRDSVVDFWYSFISVCVRNSFDEARGAFLSLPFLPNLLSYLIWMRAGLFCRKVEIVSMKEY